ncbi:MAG: 1-acyl-sn-glycerol-3-phosphate acyltransferase [Treponema sp.]|nr:1-acyl-sn-glycerol-3-phosphate acyltransferase [Treponema sp.]
MESTRPHFFSPRYFIHDFVRITSFLPGFLWWRPKHIYENQAAKKKIKGGALLISNHIGFTDPVFLMYGFWYRRLYFVALRIFFNTKVKNFWFRHFLCIPIDRENVSMETFREIVGRLKEDEIVAIFPEGKINVEKQGLQTFKSGMILMAMQSKKPILPVYIQKKKGIRHRLLIVVGEPIKIPEGTVGLKAVENATQELYNKESHLQNLADEYYGKK